MANKYFVGNGLWSSATNWRTASNGATVTTPPTASDTAFLDAFSGTVATDNTTNICGLLNCTGYTSTLTFTANQVLTVNSTLTFVAGMTIAGTGKLKLGSTSATITSGGKTITGDLEVTGGNKTLSGVWSVAGLFISSNETTLNSSSITLAGGLTIGKNVTGTTTSTITGGTLQNVAGVGQWGLTTSFAGNITISDFGLTSKTFTYTSGTITVTAGTTMLLSGTSSANIVLNNFGTNFRLQNAKSINNFYVQSGTLYIDGDFDSNGSLISHVSGNIYLAGSFNNVASTSITSLFSSGGNFILSGTGSVCTLNCYGNLTINTAGTITFPATEVLTLMYSSSARTFTYTAGTVVVEDGHRLFCSADARYINSGDIIWDIVQLGNNGVNSTIYLTGNFKCNNLYILPFSTQNGNYPDHDPRDRGNSTTVRPYAGTTITVYESITSCRSKALAYLRANSGTATIDYQGTLANMDISNLIFSNGILSVNRLYSYFGTVDTTCSNIFIIKEFDVLDGPMSITHL